MNGRSVKIGEIIVHGNSQDVTPVGFDYRSWISTIDEHGRDVIPIPSKPAIGEVNGFLLW